MCLRTLAGRNGIVRALAALPDGTLAVASDDCAASMWEAEGGVISVWDPANGTCLLTFAGHTDWEHALVALPDGKLASASSDRTVRVWGKGKCLFTLKGHTGSVTALAVLPDGKLVTGTDDRMVRVWC